MNDNENDKEDDKENQSQKGKSNSQSGGKPPTVDYVKKSNDPPPETVAR